MRNEAQKWPIGSLFGKKGRITNARFFEFFARTCLQKLGYFPEKDMTPPMLVGQSVLFVYRSVSLSGDQGIVYISALLQ